MRDQVSLPSLRKLDGAIEISNDNASCREAGRGKKDVQLPTSRDSTSLPYYPEEEYGEHAHGDELYDDSSHHRMCAGHGTLRGLG